MRNIASARYGPQSPKRARHRRTSGPSELYEPHGVSLDLAAAPFRPARGRYALQAAGLAMSAVTQSFIFVPTHEAALTLMLLGADGEVLWFGYAGGSVNVLSDRELRRLVSAAGPGSWRKRDESR